MPYQPKKDAVFEAKLARIHKLAVMKVKLAVMKVKRTEERISWALDGLL